jgi:uncharacterized protein DUF4238
VIEAFLAIVENSAAEPIKSLAALPTELSQDDRGTIAFFLALQQGRTPSGLVQHRRVAHMAAVARVKKLFSDREAVSDRYRRKMNPDATDEEIEAFATREITAFMRGERTIDLPPEAPFQAMLASVSSIAAAVAAMDWTLLESTDGEFITNDRGLAMWDPSLRPAQGNAWESSADAETTVPIAPTVCLKLTPGAERFGVETAGAESVTEVNLRTYGWADKSIFGTDRGGVEAVHRAAQAEPSKAVAPRVPQGKNTTPSERGTRDAG